MIKLASKPLQSLFFAGLLTILVTKVVSSQKYCPTRADMKTGIVIEYGFEPGKTTHAFKRHLDKFVVRSSRLGLNPVRNTMVVTSYGGVFLLEMYFRNDGRIVQAETYETDITRLFPLTQGQEAKVLGVRVATPTKNRDRSLKFEKHFSVARSTLTSFVGCTYTIFELSNRQRRIGASKVNDWGKKYYLADLGITLPFNLRRAMSKSVPIHMRPFGPADWLPELDPSTVKRFNETRQ